MKEISTVLGDRLRDDEDRDTYTDYLRAAADDLGTQFNRERAEHSATRQRLADAAHVDPPTLLTNAGDVRQ